MNQMRTRHSLRFVYVYYEGEGSERAYLRFLRSRFHDVVVIRGKKGFYPTAKQDLKKPDSDLNIKWNDIDEIWFFFDIDPDAMMDGKLNSWNNLESLIRKIRRKSKKINIRLLMTTGCIEYWFLLHFQLTQPAMDGQPFKDKVLRQLQRYVPRYRKSSEEIIKTFADSNMERAIENGQRVMQSVDRNIHLTQEEKNQQLYTSGATFSNVYEVLIDLKQIQKC